MELARGRFTDALRDFTELAARTDGDPGDLGMTHLFLGDYDASIAELRDLAVGDPKGATAPFLLAAALELAGKHDQALSEAELYRRQKPDPGIWKTLALSHEPDFLERARAIRKALHNAGLDEPGGGRPRPRPRRSSPSFRCSALQTPTADR